MKKIFVLLISISIISADTYSSNFNYMSNKLFQFFNNFFIGFEKQETTINTKISSQNIVLGGGVTTAPDFIHKYPFSRKLDLDFLNIGYDQKRLQFLQIPIGQMNLNKQVLCLIILLKKWKIRFLWVLSKKLPF